MFIFIIFGIILSEFEGIRKPISMSKKERHEIIKAMIRDNCIGTQHEIKDRLETMQIVVTQATLSRDLRELGLLKLRDEDGRLYYSLPMDVKNRFNPSALPYIQKVARAGFMLVLHTKLGEADILANIIDHTNDHAILGTIAGADTLLVICQDDTVASYFEQDLRRSIG